MIAAISRLSSGLAAAALLLMTVGHSSRLDCAEWTRRVARLPVMGRAELESYGALDDGEWVLFSKKVVPSCDPRAAFSHYTGDVVRGVEPNSRDAKTVAEKKTEFIRALIKIWPTGGKKFPGEDGAFREELSTVLVRQELDARATRPLLAKIIREDGVTSEVSYVLMTRPDAALRELIIPHAEPPSVVANANIYAVAILQTLGDDVSDELHALAGRSLTPHQRAVVQVLQSRVRSRTRPTWDDVSDLQSE